MELVTSAGLREAITNIRKKARAVPGFGKNQRYKWRREAITAYTQLRTNAGPFRAFLASDRGGHKVKSANCRRCKAEVAETGEHIVFECEDKYRRNLRRRHIAGARTWEDLGISNYSTLTPDRPWGCSGALGIRVARGKLACKRQNATDAFPPGP